MKVTFNQSIQAMWGRMGGLVFRRSHNGRVVVAAAPDMSRVKWSDAQQAHRQRFKEAVAYARAAMADETARGKYMEIAAKQGKRPFDMAVSDYFKGRNLLEG
ncbi:MAG: hypothetical protein IH589_10625 [Anaerolineales bacterium]|nr:hypothetical protein [Anaerolineales bacterium]